MVPTSLFYTLLRIYNPINEKIYPQLKQIFSRYGDNVLDQFKAHWEAKNSNKPVLAMANFFAKLDGQLKSVSDTGIVEGWRSYFNSQPPSVKTETLKLLSKPVFLGVKLPTLGPVDSKNLLQSSTTPFFNVPGASKSPVNFTNTGVRLSPVIEANLASASKLLGVINNKNITPVIGSVSKSTENHGTNLVPDSEHPKRVGKIITSYTKKIQEIAGDASGFLLKALNFNPYGSQNRDIFSPPVAFEQIVEGEKLVVDGSGIDVKSGSPTNIKSFASPKQTNLV